MVEHYHEHHHSDQALKELIEYKKQWQTTFDAISDGIALLDVNGIIQQCNLAFEKLAGCERSEVIGQPCYKVIHGSDSRIDTCPFEDAMRTGLRKSTQINLKNEVFEVIIDPVIDEEGNKTGAVHILQNITKRIKAEKSIVESEEKYRTLVENSAEGIMIAQDGLFKFVNPSMCQMLKAKAEFLLDKPFINFIHPDDQQMVVDRYEKRLTGEEVPNEYHFRIIDSNDTIVWAYVKTTLIDWLGSPAALNMLSDISESRETQEKLKESESALRMAQKTAHLGSWSWHIHENKLEWSDEMYSVFGIDKDGFNGRLSDVMQQAIHPDDIAKVEESNRAVIEDGRPYPLEYRVLWPDGQIRTIYAEAGQLIRDEKGLPKILSGIAQDITDRKQVEQALVHSHDLMRYVIENSNGAIAIHDKDMKYLYVSQRYLHDYKVKEKDIIGKHHYEVFPDLPQKWRDAHQKALSGAILSADNDSYPREDGTLEWTRWECRPWYEADGSIGGIIVYTEVITERKQAEEKLRESEERFKKLSSFTFEGIVIHNNAITIDVNQSFVELLGYQRDEIVGMNLFSIIHPDSHTLVKENIVKEVALPYQIILIRKDGSTFDAEIEGRNIYYNGEFFRVACIRDISERKQAEEALKLAEFKFRTFADYTYDWEYLEDNNNKMVYISPSCLYITGYTSDEFISNPDLLNSIIYPDDLNVLHKHHEKIYNFQNRNELEELEFRIIKKDGSIATIHHTCRPIYNEAKKFLGRRGSNRDITERKVAEMEVRKREHLLDRIFDILPVGLWIADENGKLIRSNAKGREIWGEEPLVGQENYHVFKARRLPSGQEIAPDDWALSHTINKGVTITNELIEIDAYDGQKRIILNYTAPVLNEEGKISAAIVVNQDITQLELIAEQLRQSEEKFRLIAEKASDVVWLMDLKGKSLFVTPSIKLFTGYSQSEYLAQGIAERFTPESAVIAAETMQQEIIAYSYLQKVPRDFSKTLILEYRCKDGSVKSGELLITPLFDEDENLKGLHGVTRDVTERVKINEELRKLNAELEQRVLERTAELQESNEQLSRMNKLFVGREIRMAELKEQISVLEKQMKEQLHK